MDHVEYARRARQRRGKPRWTSKVKSVPDCWDKPIAIASDRVVARADGRLVALDKRKGKQLWSVATKNADPIGRASPIIAGDTVMCVLVDDSGTTTAILHAVDLASGKLRWTRSEFPESAPLSWYCTPAVTADGTMLVQAYGLQALR